MKNMTLEAIAKAVGGQLHIGNGYDAKKEATGVVIDSRLVEEGNVFVATKGAKVDGHTFIPQVIEKGAMGVICEDAPDESYTYILVKDSFKALKDAAEYYRNQLDIKFVGIIGSVGKTSTKEIVAATLSTKYNVLKTLGNFNNEVGVPLTIFRIKEEHEIAVVEMGISDFGEMSRLGQIAKPNVVIMTNIGPCHLEKLIDLDGVLKAKTEVFDYMPDDGIIILNAQDDKLKTVKKSDNKEIIFYDGEDIYAEIKENLGLKGTKFDLNAYGKKIPCQINLPGRHMVTNSLAAAAAGLKLGLTLEEISKGIASAEGIAGRSHLIETKDYLLIDDCYNANPKSMKSAIDLMGYALGRKVAILGDMFELGEEENALHYQVGEYAMKNGIDLLICVGKLSKNMFDGALKVKNDDSVLGEVCYFENKEDLLIALKDTNRSLLRKDDTILIKASHGMGFTEIVELLS